MGAARPIVPVQAVFARWAVRNQKLTAGLAPFLPVFRSGVTGLFDGVEVPVRPSEVLAPPWD